MKKRILFGLAIVVIAVLVFAQIPGKHLNFASDRFWANDGIIRTDNRVETTGTGNGFRAEYQEGLYTSLSADSAGNLGIARPSAGTLKVFTYQADALADDGTVSLPDATDGFVIVSCNAETIFVNVTAAGVCAKVSGSTNTDVADTDAKLDVYDGGTYAIVKNRLGATGAIRIIYLYN